MREAALKPFGGLAEAPLSVTISLGVTSFRPDIADAKALLTEADTALYASKQGGRNRVTVFTPPPGLTARRGRRLSGGRPFSWPGTLAFGRRVSCGSAPLQRSRK